MVNHFRIFPRYRRGSFGGHWAGFACALGVVALAAYCFLQSSAAARAKPASANAFGLPAQAGGEKSQSKPEALALRQPLERRLAGGDAHWFSLTLRKGEFARVVVTQQGIDVDIRLLDASEQELASVDNQNESTGDEVLFWVAQASGTLRV